LPELPIDSPEKLASFINSACRQNWDEEHKALLLTSLGITVRKNLESGVPLEAVAPYGLKRFIKDNLAGSVSMREPEPADGTIGIIPSDVQIERPERLFRMRDLRGLPNHKYQSDRRVRYRPALWTGVKNPLETGKKRFLRTDFHHFVDIGVDAPPPENSIEILPSDIVGIDGPLPPEAAGKIHAAIEKFLASNQIDRSRAVNALQNFISTNPDVKSSEKTGGIDLGSLFQVLSNSDLARISVPLDIIAEALRKLR
jgi:hypothetical protein